MTTLTLDELKPNFEILYYLIRVCVPRVPLQVSINQGLIRPLGDWRSWISFQIGKLLVFVYLWTLHATVWIDFSKWEQAKRGANNTTLAATMEAAAANTLMGTTFPAFWEKILSFSYLIVYTVLLVAHWGIFDFERDSTVNSWNRAIEFMHRKKEVNVREEKKKIIKKLERRIRAWRPLVCPILASTLLFHPFLYYWYDDHPFTLLAQISPEKRTKVVTFFSLLADLAFHSSFVSTVAFYLLYKPLVRLDECIDGTSIEQQIRLLNELCGDMDNKWWQELDPDSDRSK